MSGLETNLKRTRPRPGYYETKTETASKRPRPRPTSVSRPSSLLHTQKKFLWSNALSGENFALPTLDPKQNFLMVKCIHFTFLTKYTVYTVLILINRSKNFDKPYIFALKVVSFAYF